MPVQITKTSQDSITKKLSTEEQGVGNPNELFLRSEFFLGKNNPSPGLFVELGGKPHFLGAPRLRTTWNVQSISLTYSSIISVFAESSGEGFPKFRPEVKFQIAFAVVTHGTKSDINRLQFTTAGTTEAEGNKTYEKEEPIKDLILELFSPVVVSKSNPVELLIAIEKIEAPTLENVAGAGKGGLVKVNYRLINPYATMLFESSF